MSLIVDNDRYSIDALELGPMENFIYLLIDKKTGRAAVIDPAWDAEAIMKLAREKGVNITDILLTHSHYDHINAIEGILQNHDAQLHLLKDEARFWGESLAHPSLHHGGDTIKIGESEISILHTPGHTPGSACYHIDDNLIAGDTLFVFGCGRCDLEGGDPNIMFDTLKRLKQLPGNTLLLPGHNYAEKTTSSIEEQCEGNPFLFYDDRDEFVDYRMNIHDKVREYPYHAEHRHHK